MSTTYNNEINDINEDVYTVDSSQCDNGVWLVKIPNYLSTEWMNAPDNSIVAKIVVGDQTEKDKEAAYKLICNPEFIKDKEIPTVNKFLIQRINDSIQSVTVEEKAKNLSIGVRDGKTYILQSSDIESGYNPNKLPRYKKKSLIGRVSVRCNIMPPDNSSYFALKSKQILSSNTPLKKSILCDEQGIEFKPKFTGTINKKKDAPKRDGQRIVRLDKGKLTDVICSHFEKHQYYNIKDLIDLTNQPVGVVKEVLKEVAQLSKAPGRRHVWELKPEYRHYK